MLPNARPMSNEDIANHIEQWISDNTADDIMVALLVTSKKASEYREDVFFTVICQNKEEKDYVLDCLRAGIEMAESDDAD